MPAVKGVWAAAVPEKTSVVAQPHGDVVARLLARLVAPDIGRARAGAFQHCGVADADALTRLKCADVASGCAVAVAVKWARYLALIERFARRVVAPVQCRAASEKRASGCCTAVVRKRAKLRADAGDVAWRRKRAAKVV